MLKSFFLLLFLFSCAKQTESPASNAQTSSVSPFYNTLLYSEQELSKVAHDQLKKGKGISSQTAEKCFNQEINRPGVQLQCAYLWAIEGGDNPIADALLIKNALISKEWAVAALIKRTVLSHISISDFLLILKNGENEILPILTKAAEYRLEANGGGNPKEHKQLLDFFSTFQNNERFYIPLLSLYWRLNKVAFYQLLNARCNLNYINSARMICWKSLIFHEAHGLQEEVKYALRFKLPSSWQDPDWKKFRSLFPKTANKIQKQFKE